MTPLNIFISLMVALAIIVAIGGAIHLSQSMATNQTKATITTQGIYDLYEKDMERERAAQFDIAHRLGMSVPGSSTQTIDALLKRIEKLEAKP